MHEVTAGGGASPATDDIWFDTDDTYYIGYDQTDGVCGRPRQINVTRRIDLGGTANNYDPILNLLSSGSCVAPVIDAKLEGHFYTNILGVTTPIELWGDAPYPILLRSDKTLDPAPLSAPVIMAAREAVAGSEGILDKMVEVCLEPGDGNNLVTYQYFATSKQLVGRGLRGGVGVGDMTDVVGYGPVPSENYQADSERAGIEVLNDLSNNPSTLSLWGCRDDAAYGDDGGFVGVNAEVMADVNKATLDLDMVILMQRWRNNANAEIDLVRFKRDQMEIVDGDIGYLLGTDANGAAAVGTRIGSDLPFTMEGARLVEFINDTTVRAYLDYKGDFAYNIGDNAQQAMLGSVTVEQAIAAAAETVCAIQMPAGCIGYAVSVYVVADLPGAATFEVGVAAESDRFATAVAAIAGSSDKGTKDGMTYYAAATNIVITPNAPPAAGGTVRITVHYIMVDAPTS